jgi:DNA-binding CsgD family transcriptional regulator
VPEPELLERDEELATLRGRVDLLAASGDGGAVLVEGVAGVGKSSLLRALTATASGRTDVQLLQSQGSELELELAFGAVRQLLTGAVLKLPEAERSSLLAGPGAPAAAVLGASAAPASLVDPLYSLCWVVAGLAEKVPLVLVLDDAHWLDPESARFLGYLARRLEDLPVLVVAAARTEVSDAARVAVDSLREIGTVLSPAPLSAAASAMLVDLPDAHRVTGGNPLLLHQLARSPDAASGLATAVAGRVARISPDAVALADAVSLFGSGVSLRDAATVAELELARAARAADALVADRILVASEHGHLEYAHPLLRSVLYDRIGPFARRAGHARAAAALRSRGATTEHVAAHLLAGEPAGDEASVEVLRSAAAAAEANLAPRAAARYLERADAEGAGSALVRRQLLLDLGRLQRRTGELQDAQATLTRAFRERDHAAPDPEVAVDLALTAYLNVDHRTVREVVETVQDADLAADDRLTLSMLLAESAWNVGDVETCMRLIDEVPRDLPGSTAPQRFALSMVGSVQMFRCEPLDTALATLLRAVGEDGTANLIGGVDVGDPLGWVIFADALDEAQAIAERRLDLAREAGDEALFAWTQNPIGWILAARGDLAASEAAFRLGLAQPALGTLLRTQLVLNYVETLIYRGAFDKAATVLDDAETQGRGQQQENALECRRSELAVWRGEYASALPAFERRYAEETATGVRHPNARIWIAEFADALAGVGRREEAVALVSGLVELSRTTGGVSGAGCHQLTLGRLTGDVTELERAVDILEPSPFRWLAARAQLELGAALRREGQRVRARDHLRLALNYAERHRVQHFSERARDELRLAGAKPRKLVLTGVDALTPGELRIALLAAEGRSNKEIAQHLFLTVKTIEATLVRTFRKLEITSRRELARVLAAPRGIPV